MKQLNICSNFPRELPDASYIYGYFVNTKDDVHTISFRTKNFPFESTKREMKGIGGTLRTMTSLPRLSHEGYCEDLKLLLDSLEDQQGQRYFSEKSIGEIMRMETLKDSERGSEAVYFRSLVYFWLLKAGVYIETATYVGHVEASLHSLQKNCFRIFSFMRRSSDGADLQSIHQFSTIYIFDRNFKSSYSTCMLNLKEAVIQMHRGKNEGYLSLFKEIVRRLYTNPHSEENEKIYLDFLNEIFEKNPLY